LNFTISAQNEKRTARNEFWLTFGTWFAGIAALLLFLWQVVLWFYPIYEKFPWVLFGKK